MLAVVSVPALLSTSGMVQAAVAVPPAAPAAAPPAAVSPAPPAPAAAVASPPASAASTPPAAPPYPSAAASWTERYERAKQEMLAGKFAEAATSFATLATFAPDPAHQLLASEQAAICSTWAHGGFTLVSSSSEEAQEMRAARVDRRTTGELATLYTAAVLYGIGSGIALAVGTEPDSAAGVILPSLAFAGGAAGLVALVDHKLSLRYGVPQSAVSGLFIGLEEAIVWSTWNQASANSVDEWSSGQLAALYWGTATAGALAGGILGTIYGTTPGRASLAGSGALWAALIAGFAAGALVADDDKADDRALLASALALNAGGIAGVILGSQVSPSIARVRFVDLGGIAGALVFEGLYLSLNDNRSRGQAAMGWLAGGMTVGLATAWVLTRDMDTDQPRRQRDENVLSSLIPTVAPAPHGQGMLLGVASTL